MKEGNIPCVVEHKDKKYLCYKVVGGKAHMLSEDGTKYSGTPGIDNLKVLKDTFKVREFNGYKYVQTKLGVFSLTTGNKVKQFEIIELFDI